ncbi:MAG: hypothetical protein KBC69_02975 [Candidatus Magasanikbacteria bacterium]|nr:hypothetical protein [Candidatus Magasanikbacteria bacterium]
MSLRARIFFIISVVVFLVLAISIFLIVRNKNKTTQITDVSTDVNVNNNQNNDLSIGQVATEIPAGVSVKQPSSEEVEKNAVEQLSKIFIERYGTYSTDNNGQNIVESQSLVTKSLWSRISTGLNTKNTNQTFLGLTTKVMSIDLVSWSADKATVSLKTMRTEDKNGVITNRYQNVTVEMVKESGVWLADKLTWN